MGSAQGRRPPSDRVARGEAAWAGTHRALRPSNCAQGHSGDKRLALDVFAKRIWGDWIDGGPESEFCGPQDLQIIGARDAIL